MFRSAAMAAVVLVAPALGASAAINSSEVARLTNTAQVVHDIRSTIPEEYWSRAQCVAAIPDLKKAALVFGGEYGKGVMSCRSGDGWSAPIFIQLAKGSWGFQAGAEQVDLVLLIMNERGVDALLNNNVNLGVDASVAAGPMGRQAQAGTDAYLKAEILAYSRAQGLFAGIDLSGGVLRPDEDANRDVYGASASPRTILASRDLSAPTEASAFLTALKSAPSLAKAPAAPAPAPARASRTTAAPIGQSDADLRTSIAQMQQTLDRLMSRSSSSVGPIGTTGDSTPNGAITVDRRQLLQLREQLDVILAALDRR